MDNEVILIDSDDDSSGIPPGSNTNTQHSNPTNTTHDNDNDNLRQINSNNRRRRDSEGDERRVRYRPNEVEEDDDLQILEERNVGTTSSPLIVEDHGPVNETGNEDDGLRIVGSINRSVNRSNPNPRTGRRHQIPQPNRRTRQHVMAQFENRNLNPISRMLSLFRQGQAARERRGHTIIDLNRIFSNEDIGTSSDDPDYDEATGYFPPSEGSIFEVFGFNNPFEFTNQEDFTTERIMERIDRDNEQIIDRKLRDENQYNRSIVKEKREGIKREVQGYKSAISHDDNIGCELCGITLGEGIPEDFKPDIKYGKKLLIHSAENNCLAPWFCFKQLTDTDKDLSKRVFIAKCGHLYCGRCIKNIGNRPRIKRGQPLDIDNPNVYAPNHCIATECNTRFRGKNVFTELYF